MKSSSSKAQDSGENLGSAEEFPESKPDAPRILSMKIGGNEAIIDSSVSDGKVSFRIHYDDLDYASGLSSVKISDITLSEGAEISGVENDGEYNLAQGVIATVSNGKTEQEYRIVAGYQFPNSSFDSWNKYVASDWSNGNTSGFNMTSPLDVAGGKAAKMESMDAKILGIGQFASGNIFTGYFNPKGVGATSMLSKYPDGNELIDFGRPFEGRPQYVEVDFTYEGKGDSCDIYFFLENRTATANEGKNQYRTSSDVNTLVASAWYRSASDDNSGRPNPDVVSIVEKENGFKTLRLKFKYGEPYEDSPIHNSNTFKDDLENSSGIDNHLNGYDGDMAVTHLRAVMASSANGNYYKGKVGATLVVDEIRFYYY